MGIILGGSLQMIALGWANIGAAVAPDAALASVASAIILIKVVKVQKGIGTATGIAIHFGRCWFVLDYVSSYYFSCHRSYHGQETQKKLTGAIDQRWQMIAVCLQGLRIAIPAACYLLFQLLLVRAGLQCQPGCQKV
jgi:PTS system mannose-specific IIC component